jgi:putative hydrolase of the HAD superfamily
MPLPRAVLLDLDDTILDDSAVVDASWRAACEDACRGASGRDPAHVLAAIERTKSWFWSDAERHRVGRLDMDGARLEIVRASLLEAGGDDPELAARIATTYTRLREEAIEEIPGAIDTVRWLRGQGCRLALLTNGSRAAQRYKIDRFGLSPLFDEVLVEGELDFGKPDPRIYALALARLGASPSDAWMVGDNLEWDVAQPQRMGLYAVWIDARGAGLPEGHPVRPDRIVRTLSEVRARE